MERNEHDIQSDLTFDYGAAEIASPESPKCWLDELQVADRVQGEPGTEGGNRTHPIHEQGLTWSSILSGPCGDDEAREQDYQLEEPEKQPLRIHVGQRFGLSFTDTHTGLAPPIKIAQRPAEANT
jgi:hypothetical protein